MLKFNFMKKLILIIIFLLPTTTFAGIGVLRIDTPQKGSGVYKIDILINTEGK